MRLPLNLALTPQTMLLIGAIVLGLLFVVVGTMGRKRLDGASGGRSFDDRLSQFGGRAARSQPAEVKPLAKIDAAVRKGKQGSKIANDLARADLKLTVTEFIGLKIISALLGAFAGGFIGRASTASLVISAIG